MQLTYPSHHSWTKDISAGIEIDFSGRAAKKIHHSLPRLEEAGVTYRIEPLTEHFFNDFLPLYTNQIGAKDNALLHDVVEKTLHNKSHDFPYYSFSLWEHGEFIGGTIFSLRTDKVSYAFRVFVTDWNQSNLKASPALIGEYVIAEFATKEGKKFLSHGKDRNPYGINAAIGLATFKLSVGCKATVATGSETRTIDTTTIDTDCLILEQPTEGDVITNARLVTSRDTYEKYIQVTKYPNLLSVEVLFRD
jgi:hypothetical protein